MCDPRTDYLNRMRENRSITDARRDARRAFLAALAAMGLTALHHVYGAARFDTPWRLHAAFVALCVVAAIVPLYLVHRRHPDARPGRLAGTGMALVVLVFPVLLFGLFEGAYNHAVKNALYLAGLPHSLLVILFPPPTYQMPSDVLFEVTGVLQIVPAWMSARSLVRLAPSLRSRRWSVSPRR